MKILFIVPYVPDQIRTRPFNFIKSLKARGHHISVVTLWSDEWERQSLDQLDEICDEVHAFHQKKSRSLMNCVRVLPTQMPLQAVYSWSPAVANFLAEITPDLSHGMYDIVHVEHLRGSRYGLELKQLFLERGISVPVVWDSVDCISLLFEQASRQSRSNFGKWVTRFEKPRTRIYEAALRDSFDRVVTTSRVDADALRRLPPERGGGCRIEVVTNGVDIGYFHPDHSIAKARKTLVMTGKMSYHANVTMAVHFCQEILPRILSEDPEVQLWIVGKDPARNVRNLASLPGVRVVGTVPDLRPYLWKSTIAVVPLTYAVGVQSKVLEAMACATPVVMSTACKAGLGVRSGHDALVADSDEDFANKVLSLIENVAQRKAIADAGRRFAESNHSWGVVVQRLEEVYDELISAGG
jgi:sugar transferase (PEP-CTERM/EpsH1 system associated)